ncbi:6-phosphogluconate dehydrogenase [Synergistales bacterium]|nr:6-phosphogluconate dehydrogenase [Synergistales bacterium]
MNIGFIGFGEAAYCISKGFQEQNAINICAYDAMESNPTQGGVIKKRAKESGVTLLASAGDVARNVSVLIASVPSSYTLDVCKEVLDSLQKGQIYADVSASTPATKEQIWSMLEPKGILFVDAAMLGSLPQDRHRVPITASGNGAQAFFDVMTPLGMRITLAGDRPGAASAIKLVRSIFMKGIAACMYEMLQGADAYGVCDEVIASTAKSLDGIPFTEHLNRLVTGTSIHAVRRAAELKGSVKMLEECDLDASMSVAAMRKHELIGEYRFADQFTQAKPARWSEIIQKMRAR